VSVVRPELVRPERRKAEHVWTITSFLRLATFTTLFRAHFAQFLSSLAFDKKTSALHRSFLVPTFVYGHCFVSLLVASSSRL
jgi:hypothetical protein